ncbi:MULTISPECIES: IS701 family transposase [unclassified Streptomyces]|uniref:IS701 family transposase n=1 Tax=unclassified Streptomyces TaxID=2593676 RepID=UPI0037F740B9
MIDDLADASQNQELDELFIRVGHRFGHADLRRRMRDYIRGLLSPVGRKNGWQLAEFVGHRTPDGFQRLLNRAVWDAGAVRDDLQTYVAEQLGDDGGVLIIDDTGFVKKGTTSAGVQRQYSGTAGRTENRQIGVFAAYATARGRALVDRDLYLPRSWTDDSQRCRAAKVPEDRAFATKGELAKTMVVRALASPLTIAWVTADSAYGQEWRFRRLLEEAAVGYVLAVPKSQHVPRFGRIDYLFTQAPQVTGSGAWATTAQALGTSWHLVAPDQAGFGRTPIPAGSRGGLRLWTGQAAGLMDALGGEHYAVVGHSMGGVPWRWRWRPRVPSRSPVSWRSRQWAPPGRRCPPSSTRSGPPPPASSGHETC